MDKIISFVIAFLVFVFCSVAFFGCTGKKYKDLEARPSAEWMKNAVIDEVDLRSFSKRGTFQSLQAQIPKLKMLGVTVVSLMPIHPIGELNRRGERGSPFAVRDFYGVNPEFGTLEEFKSLTNVIHQHGLKIIITLVANQAAWDSQLLMEHPNWFVHNEEGAIVSPNAEWSDVAQLDYHQHELRKYMMAMMKFWIQEIGIDGFESSAAEPIPTDFWEIARSELEKIKPVLMISDGRLPEHHLKAFDLTGSWNIHKTIANIVQGTCPATVIEDSLEAELQYFPKRSLHLRFNRDDEDERDDVPSFEHFDPQCGTAMTILSFTLPGVSLIYNVNEVQNDKKIEWYEKLCEDLGTLRRNHSALQDGSYMNLQNTSKSQLFSFIRFLGTDSVLVVINFAHEKKETDIHLPAGASPEWKDQFSVIHRKGSNSRLMVSITPFGFLILVPSSEKELL